MNGYCFIPHLQLWSSSAHLYTCMKADYRSTMSQT